MSTSIVRVPFHGDVLEAIQHNGSVRVVIKRTCENVGIDYSGQLKSLKKLRWAGVEMISTTGPDGKTYEMGTIPLKALPMWMSHINPNKVRHDLRGKLELYQEKAADVLAEYFGFSPSTVNHGEQLIDKFMTVAIPAMTTAMASIVTSAVQTIVTSAMNDVLSKWQSRSFDDNCIGSRGATAIKRALKEYAETMAPLDKKQQRKYRSSGETDLRAHIKFNGPGRTLDRIPCDSWEDVKYKLEELMKEAKKYGPSIQGSLFDINQ